MTAIGRAAAVAQLNDLELYYETLGQGPPLVLMHGSLMTLGLMNDYPDLLAANRQVIAVELQGHGRTRDIGRPLRYEMLADDVAELLEHLGLAQADLVVAMIADFLDAVPSEAGTAST